MRTVTFPIVVLLVLCLIGCNSNSPSGSGANDQKPPPQVVPVTRADTTAIAVTIPTTVATVKRQVKGTQGAPVVVIEESHNARMGQLEIARVLASLHDKFGLNHIALEGYLKEDARDRPIDRTAFAPALQHGTPLENAKYASQLVREGDISGVEFMPVVYNDVTIHPAEIAAQYSSDTHEVSEVVVFLYLGQIAEGSLDASGQKKALAYIRKMGPAGASGSVTNQLKALKYLISLDPWTRDTQKAMQDPKKTSSIEEEIKINESIQKRAEEKSVPIAPAMKQKFDDYLKFLHDRSDASKTIVASVAQIADAPDVSIVAVDIGAGHTDAVCALLKGQSRPFILVSPSSLQNRSHSGLDMSYYQLQRKYAMQPVVDGSLNRDLLAAFPILPRNGSAGETGNNKPKPVLQQEWFQAKAELYSSGDTMTSLLNRLPPPPPPGGGGPPPVNEFGEWQFKHGHVVGFILNKDRLNHKYFVIDPTVEVVNADSKGERKELVFHAILHPDDPKRRRSVWMKVGHVDELSPDHASAKTVEDVLDIDIKRAKREAPHDEAEPERPKEQVARIQISLDTKAIVAASRQAVLNTEIRY